MPVQLNLIFAASTTVGNNHDTGSNVPVNRVVLDTENDKVFYSKTFLLTLSDKPMIISIYFIFFLYKKKVT